MASKGNGASVRIRDLDKELPPPPLSNHDFTASLLLLTIVYGVVFSLSAVLLNCVHPPIWTFSPIMAQVTVLDSPLLVTCSMS